MKDDASEKPLAAVDQLTPQQVQSVIGRERRALADFCQRVLPIYRAIAYSRLVSVGQHTSAKQEDLVQSLMEATLREEIVRKWRPELGRLSSYLRIFAKRRALDLLLSKAGRSCEKLMEATELAATSDKRTPSEELSLEDRLLWKQLVEEMRKNPDPEYVTLFERHYLLGESPEDVAQVMGKDVQTIYKRIQRMRKDIITLRDRLLGK